MKKNSLFFSLNSKPQALSLFPAVALCALSLMCLPSAAAEDINAERQQALLHLLKQDCGSCHGMTLQGGLGPALTVDALSQRSVAELVHTITYGREALAMPAWRQILSANEIEWLSRQLKQGVPAE